MISVECYEAGGLSYGDDVDKVILPQRVQDGVDGVSSDGHLQTLHAATDVHHNDDVLGRGGCLDVPSRVEENTTIIFTRYTQTWPVTKCCVPIA